jgi:hypothetical protein
MQKTTENPTTMPETADGLVATALRAEGWAGEPFLHPGEDPVSALAHGAARRLALDEALAEIEAGRRKPSPDWKVRFGLMLGLERVLSEKPPRLASGTELRRHQIDALAGMLTELIAASPEQYRDIAVDWASDLPRLARLRLELRERMRASPIRQCQCKARKTTTILNRGAL